MKIRSKSPQSFCCCKFSLVNLVLDEKFELNLKGYNIFFEPVKEYSDITKRLEASKGIAITCEIKMEVISTVNKDEIMTLIDDICGLLSLARGCRITWLYYDFLGEDGTIIESFHRDSDTKLFGSYDLIPSKDTKDFILKTYPHFIIKEPFWELNKAIDAFTDGKAGGGYLQSSALKLVILMEHFKSRYLKQKGKEYILAPEVFDVSVDQLRTDIQEILTLRFPDEDQNKISMMVEHIKGLNRVPFARALSEICKYIRLAANSEERKQFVDIRNELVHYYKFCDLYGGSLGQYHYLMTFISKIFLAILKYDGGYKDWTMFGQDETQMIKKMKLLEPLI